MGFLLFGGGLTFSGGWFFAGLLSRIFQRFMDCVRYFLGDDRLLFYRLSKYCGQAPRGEFDDHPIELPVAATGDTGADESGHCKACQQDAR